MSRLSELTVTYVTRGPSVSLWPYFNLGRFPMAALLFLSPCLPLCSAKRYRVLVMRPKEGSPIQLHGHKPVFPWSSEIYSSQLYMECAWPLWDLAISSEQTLPFTVALGLNCLSSKGLLWGKSIRQGQVTAREVYVKGWSLCLESANCSPPCSPCSPYPH